MLNLIMSQETPNLTKAFTKGLSKTDQSRCPLLGSRADTNIPVAYLNHVNSSLLQCLLPKAIDLTLTKRVII